MKVAFTSTNGEKVDQHFGMARSFFVWEVGPDEAKFLREVAVPSGEDAQGRAAAAGATDGGAADEEDKITARADAIAGCAIVYTLQIGGPAAAKLVARRIHPMKTTTELAVTEALTRLQEVLKGTPPPWLRKAMGGSAKDCNFSDPG